MKEERMLSVYMEENIMKYRNYSGKRCQQITSETSCKWKSIGLFPTIGLFTWKGHVLYYVKAREEWNCSLSVFVNPLQFGQMSLDRYLVILIEMKIVAKRKRLEIIYFIRVRRNVFQQNKQTTVEVVKRTDRIMRVNKDLVILLVLQLY